MEKTCGIYGLHCRATEKWYVGQSVDIESRWRKHYKNIKCKTQVKLYRALLKYGYDGFDKVVLDVCDRVEWILDYREMHWIRILNSLKNGYNLTEGGHSGRLSEESCKKISATMKSKPGHPQASDTRKKISDAQRGIPRGPFSTERRKNMSKSAKMRTTISQETRQKMSDAQRGKVVSDETKQKLAIARQKRVMPPMSEENKRKLRETMLARWAAEKERRKVSFLSK